MLINKNSLPDLDMFAKNLISSGEYSLFFLKNEELYMMQSSDSNFYILSKSGKFIKKIENLPVDFEPVYFDDIRNLNSLANNFCQSLHF